MVLGGKLAQEQGNESGHSVVVRAMAAAKAGEWAMQDGCVVRDPSGHTAVLQRSKTRLLPRRQLFFTEFGLKWVVLNISMDTDSLQCSQVATPKTAFLFTSTQIGDVFHSMHHAIPAADWFVRSGLAGGSFEDVVLIDQMLFPWLNGRVPASPLDLTGYSGPVWRGFHLLLLSLGFTQSDHEAAASLTRFRPHGCWCFSAVVGGATAFHPAQLHNKAMMQRFRERVSGSLFVLLTAPSPQQRILFINRSLTRRVENYGEVSRSVVRSGAFRVMYVAMETLTLREQARLVATSRVLAGVHGNGLGWTMMLPTSQHQCALLEVYPTGSRVHDYMDWSIINNVAYYALDMPASRITANASGFRCKDVVMDLQRFQTALDNVVAHL